MTPGPGVEFGPHWWEASALTTAPSLLPARTSRKFKDLGARQALRWRLPYKPYDRDPDERAHVLAEEETNEQEENTFYRPAGHPSRVARDSMPQTRCFTESLPPAC